MSGRGTQRRRAADLPIFKEFGLGTVREGMRLEYRFETFNTFNHPQFCGPDTTFGSPNFGKTLYQCNGPARSTDSSKALLVGGQRAA